MGLLSKAALVLAALAPAALADPSLVTVWQTDYSPGAYPHCFRQPVLLAVNDSTIVAFAEGRNNTWCSGTNDGSPSSIRTKRSIDGGLTWGPETLLYTGGVDYLGGVVDYQKGTIFFFVQLGSSVLTTQSSDAGATWSGVAPLKTLSGPNGYTAIPAVAHGIQIVGDLCSEPTCGGTVGRLVMPFVCLAKKAEQSEAARLKMLKDAREAARVGGDVACPGCYSCLAVSDDHGSTWSISAGAVSIQEGSREASVAQVLSSSYAGAQGSAAIYASERNLGNSTGYRLHAISTDAGSTFSSFGADKGLPDGKVTNWTGIVAGLTRFDGPSQADAAAATQAALRGAKEKEAAITRRLVFATPMSATARADMALFVSLDEGLTWSSGALYRAGPAGYNDISQLNATHCGILFENGDDEFAQRISFGTFTVADLPQ